MTSKQPLGKLSVIRGNGLELGLSEYFDARHQDLHKRFRERKYTTDPVGLSYRLINYWDQQGVLPEASRSSGEWRKFTYIEAVWLRVAMRLRDFGVPLSIIAEIKDCILEWNEKIGAYTLFEYYFYKAVVNNTDHFVIYVPKVGAALASARELEIGKHFFKDQDMLLISLKAIARSMGLSVAKSDPLYSLSEAEQEMVMQARLPHTREIRAAVKRGKVTEIEDTKIYPDASLLRELTKSVEGQDFFGGITAKYERGKRQSVEIKNRKKFK